MNLFFYIEFLSLISFLVFFIVNFIEIESNSKINKIVYLSNLLFISFINLIYYKFIILNPVSVLKNIVQNAVTVCKTYGKKGLVQMTKCGILFQDSGDTNTFF